MAPLEITTEAGLRMREHFEELRRNGVLTGDLDELARRWEDASKHAVTSTPVSKLSFGSSGGFDGGTGTEQNTTPLKPATPSAF